MAGLGTSVKEDTNFRLHTRLNQTDTADKGKVYLEYPADSIEQPTMRIDLFLILGFDDENDLNRNEVLLVILLG